LESGASAPLSRLKHNHQFVREGHALFASQTSPIRKRLRPSDCASTMNLHPRNFG
jgi:hypothetical protein